MMSFLFCLYIAATVLPSDANSLVDFSAFEKILHGVHLDLESSAFAKGYFLTETHFGTNIKTICTHSGCSSFAVKGCPKGWKTFSGNCYKVLPGKKKWIPAQLACLVLEANVVDITSERENVWLAKAFPGLYTWLGATDEVKEGEFRWTSSRKLLTYTAWNKGEPNDDAGNEDCSHVYMRYGKLVWNDRPCTGKLKVLCKKRA